MQESLIEESSPEIITFPRSCFFVIFGNNTPQAVTTTVLDIPMILVLFDLIPWRSLIE